MIEIILVFQIVGDMTGQQEHITKQEWVGSDGAYEVKVNVLHILKKKRHRQLHQLPVSEFMSVKSTFLFL